MLVETALTALLLAAQAVDVETLVKQLGSESVETREKAQAELEKRGAAALPVLKRAVGSGDPEISAKARQVIVRIRGGQFVRSTVEKVSDPLSRFGRADHFQVSPDEKLAVGANLKSLSIWTVPEGALVRRLTPHPRGLNGMVLSPDGTRLLTVGNVYTEMAIWEFPSLRLIRKIDSDRRSPDSIAPAPDGLHLALGANDEVFWIRAETGEVVWRWSEKGLYTVRDVDVSPDGKRVAVVGANDSNVKILETFSGRVTSEVHVPSTGHSSTIRFSVDGTRVVVTNPDHDKAWLFYLSGEKALRTARRQEEHALAGRDAHFVIERKAGGAAPKGKTLIVAERFHPHFGQAVPSPDDRYLIVQAGSWKPLLRFDLKDGRKLGEIGERVNVFAVSEKGVLAGTADGKVVLYDLEGKKLRGYTHGKGAVELVAFGGADRVLSFGRDLVLRCWDFSAGRELWRREYLPFSYHVHRFTPDNRHVVSRLDEPGSSKAVLARWSTETGRVVRRYGKFAGYIAGIGVSPDGNLVAASGRDGPLAVWEVVTGKKLWEHRPGKNARWLAFTPDSASLLAGDDEGRLARYAARTGTEERVYRVAGGRILKGAISGDGKLVAATGDGLRLRVFHVESGQVYRRFRFRGYNGVAFLEKTKEVIYAGSVTRASLETGETLFVAGRKPVKAVRLDSSRTRLATLVYYSTFIVNDLTTGQTLTYVGVPPEASDFVLGPGARSAVFLNGAGNPIALTFGDTVKKVGMNDVRVIGSNPARGDLYCLKRGKLQVRDTGSLNVLSEVLSEKAAWVSSPHESPWIYASIQGKIVRMHHERLDGAFAMDLPKDLKGLDATPDGLFLSGLELFDPQGRSFGKIKVELPGKLLRSYFGADGEKIIVLTKDGKVVTLRPGK